MSSKQKSQKMQKSQKLQIIQFKDIVSILLILVILFMSVSSVFGAVQNAQADETVVARDLIMFASLAYADLEKINGYNITVDSNKNDKPRLNFMTKITDLSFNEYPMVTDNQLRSIKSSTVLLGIPLSDEKENTYDYLFYGLASVDNEVSDWKLVNYTKYNTTIFKGMAEFTAMTFKRGDDIVIAYRGTDFDDIGDWAQDLFYGLVGYAGQEGVAQDYARTVAKHFVSQNPNTRIYVTGHSLGGYLAQIGGAALVEQGSPYRNNVKEISYFNGMGLKFWSNIAKKITSTKLSLLGIKKTQLNQLLSDNSPINLTQNNAMNALKSWKNKGKLISYHIKGDLISSLGTHVGTKVGLEPYNLCIEHHDGNQIYSDILSSGLFTMIKGFLNEDVSKYVKQYRPQHPLKYVWITHETDSFFGRLPFADGTEPADVTVELNVPKTIKYNKTADATLIIKTKNASLNKASLTTDDFIVNSSKVKINSIQLKSSKTVGDDSEYVYTLKLKGGLVIGNSNITLKSGALKLTSLLKNRQQTMKKVINELSNNILESINISTKLR